MSSIDSSENTYKSIIKDFEQFYQKKFDIVISKCQKQNNDYDCGIYVLNFIKKIILDIEDLPKPLISRIIMSVELITGTLFLKTTKK